jgi:hypothetical protein
MKFYINIFVFTFFLYELTSCTKFVQVSPPTTQLVGSTVYNSDATAASAVTGIYLTMATGYPQSIGGGTYGLSATMGLSADEFSLYPNNDPTLNQSYSNSLLSGTPTYIWPSLYNYIYQANSAIEGISSSAGVSPSMKQQLVGESSFVRALCNFYLVNLYGDIPLLTITDYKINELAVRSPQVQVYQQIVTDLQVAKNFLSDNFLTPNGDPTTDRVRPNRSTASALLARAYLYEQKWDSAESEATAVINNPNFSLVTDLDSAFLANNTEAIWQLQIPNTGLNTNDGAVFLLSNFGGPSKSYPFILSDSLVNSFELNDLRRTNWVDSIVVNAQTYFFPFKYKLYYTGLAPTEYPVIFRLAEQYLIRAEARAQQNSLTGSAADLNIIRNRAGLANTTATTQQDLLNAIYRERRIELFTELGHRWFDLKRTGKIDSVMTVITPQKGGTWETSDQLFPIPLGEIQLDPNLTQNPGYN